MARHSAGARTRLALPARARARPGAPAPSAGRPGPGGPRRLSLVPPGTGRGTAGRGARPALPWPHARRGRARWVRPAVRGTGTALLLAAVALAVAVAVVPVVAGGTVLTVLSSSMAPTFTPGDLVVIRPRPAAEIRVGDVVAFTGPDPATGTARTVTHRVVGVEPGPQFRTKGDANTVPDPAPVAAADVRGVSWYVLPVVGGWGTALRTVPGMLVVSVLMLVVAAMVLVPARRG